MRFAALLTLGLLAGFAARAQDFVGQEIEKFRRDQGRVALVDGTETNVVIDYAPRYNSYLNVLYPDGKTAVLEPHQVKWFTTGNYYFITTSEKAESPTAANTEDYDGDFVQVVDTGKVILVRGYTISGSPSVGIIPNGVQVLSKLLVRRREDKAWTKVPKGVTSSAKFRTMAARFLAGRDDLLDALKREVITPDNFARCVKAYNHGELMNFNQE